MSMFKTEIRKSHNCWYFTICWLLMHIKGAWPWTWCVGYENRVKVTLIFFGIKGGTSSSMIAVLMKKFEKATNYDKKSYLSNKLLQFALLVRRLAEITAF